MKFSTWVYQIAHNETISAFRKSKSRGEEKRTTLEPELFDNLADEFDFVAAFEANLTAEKVRKVLAMLPENYREVLILRFIEDKSYDEIADIIQKPPGTVATLINRAKAAFKRLGRTTGNSNFKNLKILKLKNPQSYSKIHNS